MPRTKAPRKKTQRGVAVEESKYLAMLEDLETRYTREATAAWNAFISEQKAALVKAKVMIPPKLTNITLGELRKMPEDWTGNATSVSIYPLNVTKSSNQSSVRSRRLRSSSTGTSNMDEGYRTGDSNGPLGSNNDVRKSRAKTRTSKVSRKSRSVPIRSDKTRNYTTPAQKIPKNSFGTITPKMQPNTPQVLLRRPKQGEVAVSMQGSPLLTGGVMGDGTANINIPLIDGRLLSLQPQRGLRISQIPHLDAKTRMQLELLRDNLDKVCRANK